MSALKTPAKSSGRVVVSYSILVIGLALSARLIFGGALFPSSSPVTVERADQSTMLASLDSTRSTHPAASTRSIESIRVGDRVLAENPEIAPEERARWQEPDWQDWLHLTLQMPLPTDQEDADPPILDIEILRPEQWVLDQLGVIVAQDEDAPAAGEYDWFEFADSESALVPYSPLRPTYRSVAELYALANAADAEVLGLTVDIDLPEMGAVGTALVSAIQPCPSIKSSAGQVVTATFAHPPTRQVLDVVFEGELDAIGVTDNHLFWSVDRQEFVPIGNMEIGERVVTFHGDTKRIESRLPRPGPQLVYNLEVYGEHVYFVGQQGLLVHNAYSRGKGDGTSGDPHARPNAALTGTMITNRTNKTGEKLDDLFEFADPKLASRQGLGFAEEGHHFWPKWLGGPDDGPLLNVRMEIHRGSGVGMHQRLNSYLVDSGLVPKSMVNNSSWIKQNLTSSQVKRSLYQFYRSTYPNLPGVPKRLSDAAKSVNF